MKGFRKMLLSWFRDYELGVCPRCGQKHVLPATDSATRAVCVSCGIGVSEAPRTRTAA